MNQEQLDLMNTYEGAERQAFEEIIYTYNVQTGDFMIAVVIAHGQWKEVTAETGLIKVEVNQQGQAAQAITKAH